MTVLYFARLNSYGNRSVGAGDQIRIFSTAEERDNWVAEEASGESRREPLTSQDNKWIFGKIEAARVRLSNQEEEGVEITPEQMSVYRRPEWQTAINGGFEIG